MSFAIRKVETETPGPSQDKVGRDVGPAVEKHHPRRSASFHGICTLHPIVVHQPVTIGLSSTLRLTRLPFEGFTHQNQHIRTNGSNPPRGVISRAAGFRPDPPYGFPENHSVFKSHWGSRRIQVAGGVGMVQNEKFERLRR